MLSYSLPPFVEPDNFDNFIKYRKGDIRNNLLSFKKTIKYRYVKYKLLFPRVELLLPGIIPEEEAKTLAKIYEDYSSKAVKKFREDFFDHVTICPYCGIDETSALDHFLPQSKFPEYILYSFNLVPACTKCNSKYKSSNYHSGGNRLFFHPYTESINNIKVLTTDISINNGSMIISYRVSGREKLTHDTYHVLKRHFRELKLNKRYTRRAFLYLEKMKPHFLRGEGTAASFRAAVNSSYEDSLQEHGRNNWKTSLLKAMLDCQNISDSDFFNND